MKGLAAALAAIPREFRVAAYVGEFNVHLALERGWAVKRRRNGWRNSRREPIPDPELWERVMHLLEGREATWDWRAARETAVLTRQMRVLAAEAERTAFIEVVEEERKPGQEDAAAPAAKRSESWRKTPAGRFWATIERHVNRAMQEEAEAWPWMQPRW